MMNPVQFDDKRWHFRFSEPVWQVSWATPENQRKGQIEFLNKGLSGGREPHIQFRRSKLENGKVWLKFVHVGQLVELSLPTPEVRGTNPVVGKIYIEHLRSTVLRVNNKEKAVIKTCICSCFMISKKSSVFLSKKSSLSSSLNFLIQYPRNFVKYAKKITIILINTKL